ncbi:MAG: hypothetical protein HY280_10630 [Nitrospinae bacterium]|nr:hypothetical protein [Nitrospinota bacterium]
MKGVKLFHRKKRYPDGGIIEMKIWRVAPAGDKPHGLKVSLVFIKNGERVIGYDNAEGRGYHRHYLNRVENYDFRGVDALMADFLKDVSDWRIKHEN